MRVCSEPESIISAIYSLQLDRKPSKCIVFEDDPRGVTAAHNCTMMAIALIGPHPAYVTLQLCIYFFTCSNYASMRI